MIYLKVDNIGRIRKRLEVLNLERKKDKIKVNLVGGGHEVLSFKEAGRYIIFPLTCS